MSGSPPIRIINRNWLQSLSLLPTCSIHPNSILIVNSEFIWHNSQHNLVDRFGIDDYCFQQNLPAGGQNTERIYNTHTALRQFSVLCELFIRKISPYGVIKYCPNTYLQEARTVHRMHFYFLVLEEVFEILRFLRLWQLSNCEKGRHQIWNQMH